MTASTSKLSNGPYPPDYPLPKISPQWDLKRYLPRRFPPTPSARRPRAESVELSGDVEMADGNENPGTTVMETREEERKVVGVPWGRDWEQVACIAPHPEKKVSGA